MTVYNELNKIAYIGNTSQTLYPIPFEYIDTEDIKVSIYTSTNEFVEEWRYSTQYVIEGGNVKVLSGYAIDNTKKLLILRQVDLIQDNKYREGGDFPAKSTETSFDKLTMITQQLQETLDRCVKVEVLDNQTPEELLAEVYNKLDSATDVAQDAIAAANEATIAAEQATTAVEEAKKQVIETQEYVDAAKTDVNNTRDEAVNTVNTTSSSAISTINTTVDTAKSDINNTVAVGKQEINTTIDEAQMSLSDTIEQAVEDVKAEAVAAAERVISDAGTQATQIATDNINAYVTNNVTPTLDSAISTINTTKDEAVNELSSVLAADKSTLESYVDSTTANATIADNAATVSRTWATGTDEEVQAIEDDEHSSRTYANFAMALANAAEDVPVLESTLLATNVIKGPKGDKGDIWNGGNITNSINVVNDSNHPIQITGMAGASATGYQIIDSNGAGESDFEHYATGDRYGTRITNKNSTSGTTSNIDFYQSNEGRSVLDLSKVQTILAPALLGAIYPVGSYYLSETAECPLAELITNSQWEIVGTSLVSGTEAAVVGTGMSLGLTDGTTNYALRGTIEGNNQALSGSTTAYGSTIGTAGGGADPLQNISYGITTDPTKSGIVTNLPAITVNIFRRIQ